MHNSTGRAIDGSSSILLDSIRIASAVIVLINHAVLEWLTGYPDLNKEMDQLAHAAVVVFFVLSGYLIAFTTTKNNRGPKQYAIARLSRLYSVVLPALLLTAIIEIVVHNTNPSLASQYARGSSWPRYALSALFCNEAGVFSASPPINGPLWSLSFEFWYYTIFGLWFYRKPNWKSLLLLAGGCFIAGPKIILLMPIWLFGLLAYRLPRPIFTKNIAWLFTSAYLFIALIIAVYAPAFPFELGQKPLFYANRFITDWIIGVFIALSIWSLPQDEHAVKAPDVKLLRTVADLSFPLYILHYPLFILWKSLFGWRTNDVGQMCQVTFFVSLIALIIGAWMENQRNVWVRFFRWLIPTGR
ncbi:MAG: acyltransferase family protein [Janthinobacterium lividum]